ncbi:hypothetical protein JTE90_026176 [Oedothorax gibbosus]|uniref:Acid sphingomyelinase-like phosphodiesterase 3b n=1 Tax=Oedothorax gibbosus TaxID=931172 RepID=A0AAV6UF52_9ARAC|nr:hypothetical protein JTE90_026176 [Oedothorax gibbosus]
MEGIKCVQHGYFWHVSDFHVDQNYSRTGNPHKLCHSENGKSFSDNGLYGNFLCDSPQKLINVTVSSMKRIQPKPDFILWTGDNLPHTVDFNPDWNVTFEAIRNISQLLHSTFPGIAIIPCIGNHDTFPPNILAPEEKIEEYKQYLELGGWDQLIPKEAWPDFIQGGFFSMLVKPKLRVISLNTILWYTNNKLTEDIADPANQFKWLGQLLKNATKASEKVYIIGHVAPGFYSRTIPGKKGDSTYHPNKLVTFNRILHYFSNIIIGQMYGHYHIDMFTVSQYGTGNFEGSALLASSVTPWHQADLANVSIPVNPSIRLMHYSLQDSTLLDYDQFYMNLTKANANHESSEETASQLYEKLYTFTEFYEVKDLSTPSLVAIYEKLKQDPKLFESFYVFLSAGERSTACDATCKVAQLCGMACTSLSEYNECMRNVDSVHHIRQRLGRDVVVNSALIYGSVALGVVIISLVGFLLYRRFRKPSNYQEYQAFAHF